MPLAFTTHSQCAEPFSQPHHSIRRNLFPGSILANPAQDMPVDKPGLLQESLSWIFKSAVSVSFAREFRWIKNGPCVSKNIARVFPEVKFPSSRLHPTGDYVNVGDQGANRSRFALAVYTTDKREACWPNVSWSAFLFMRSRPFMVCLVQGNNTSEITRPLAGFNCAAHFPFPRIQVIFLRGKAHCHSVLFLWGLSGSRCDGKWLDCPPSNLVCHNLSPTFPNASVFSNAIVMPAQYPAPCCSISCVAIV